MLHQSLGEQSLKILLKAVTKNHVHYQFVCKLFFDYRSYCKMSENSQQKAQGDVFRCLILFDQQSKDIQFIM